MVVVLLALKRPFGKFSLERFFVKLVTGPVSEFQVNVIFVLMAKYKELRLVMTTIPFREMVAHLVLSTTDGEFSSKFPIIKIF